MKSHAGPLILHDWCPWKKRTNTCRENTAWTRRENTQSSSSTNQGEKTGETKPANTLISDIEPLVLWENNTILLVKPLCLVSLVLRYVSPANKYSWGLSEADSMLALGRINFALQNLWKEETLTGVLRSSWLREVIVLGHALNFCSEVLSLRR